ncbi:hypothetical protein CEXT_503241 [Caerostris extrusa]|uniref:Uncharacterized protein n=1 Tax=Caerostris extrusa TaxID=172846 RepID=A0AAV4P1B1_CAEEX|nr:hypothetical protein CEXT_503241 [Caerostris extrusa]
MKHSYVIGHCVCNNSAIGGSAVRSSRPVYSWDISSAHYVIHECESISGWGTSEPFLLNYPLSSAAAPPWLHLREGERKVKGGCPPQGEDDALFEHCVGIIKNEIEHYATKCL